MNANQQARLIIDGGLLADIEDKIKRGYFDEWQSAKVVEDREAIFAKQAALESVLFEIKELAKGILKNVS